MTIHNLRPTLWSDLLAEHAGHCLRLNADGDISDLAEATLSYAGLFEKRPHRLPEATAVAVAVGAAPRDIRSALEAVRAELHPDAQTAPVLEAEALEWITTAVADHPGADTERVAALLSVDLDDDGEFTRPDDLTISAELDGLLAEVTREDVAAAVAVRLGADDTPATSDVGR